MRKHVLILACMLMAVIQAGGTEWKGQWISSADNHNEINTWQVFRKTVTLPSKPKELQARIAVDSKYWLWINGTLAVFEGGLKRGPSPSGTYYDKVDIAPYLKKGNNVIAVLSCFFGKEGFSHKNSGCAGFLFDAQGEGISIVSDGSWEALVAEAYGRVRKDTANYRLPESSICYDGNKDLGEWYSPNYTGHFPKAKVVNGQAVNNVWGELVERPIPMFIYTPLKKYVSTKYNAQTRKLRCQLPYDAQVTPYIKVRSKAGNVIDIRTDCYDKSGVKSVRAEYVTREGVQSYENLGWMNGNWVEYTIPEGTEVLEVRYRESGYDTEIAGSFECNDPFWNELWKRSARTLYLNMRDTYFDCPDRERAQWWGDMVNDIQENIYVLTPSSWKLIYKGMHELMNWQKPDWVIFSPIPAGNWDKELPVQMLMSLGMYGFYAQYFYSGENHFIAPLYDRVHKYLHKVWKVDNRGFVPVRQGGWSWADWGSNIDLELLTNEWYFLALSAEQRFANMLGKKQDEAEILAILDKLQENFNARYWTGTCYKSPDYTGEIDDRAQALAVLTGMAGEDKYPALLEILKKNHYASPLVEMYVQEAMFKMGQGREALKRAKEQYSNMMSFKDETTVFEFWDYKGEGGTNHAWASSMTVILARDVCGIRPTSPGFRTFEVAPQMSGLEWAKTSLVTTYGKIKVELKENSGKLKAKVTVPAGTEANLKWNGKTVHLLPGTHTKTL